MYVEAQYILPETTKKRLYAMRPIFGFNQFGEIVYYRSYSRLKPDGTQERWPDTVIRVIEGVMSIRLDWYHKNHIKWDVEKMDAFASAMAESLFRMEWLPPGRGLWAMGSELIRERGAMALYNCAFTLLTREDWIEDLCWMMDSLMHGVGVGFKATDTPLDLREPDTGKTYTIADTREGWVDSVRVLLRSFLTGDDYPCFDYSLIRPYGAPIKSFGGTASGPEPLKQLHDTISDLCYKYIEGDYPTTSFLTDLGNLIGKCVVAGNVRRSAEIALGDLDDESFLELKNYDKNAYRAGWGWMSNNSVTLSGSDFLELDTIAQLNIKGYDMGILNMENIPYARVGKRQEYPLDRAEGINPCGEIPLEHREVCNVAETCPTRCVDYVRWLQACEYATFYCSTVALLPTHQHTTNAVVARNRRIGISIIDFTGWKEQTSVCELTEYLRAGYGVIRKFNKMLADEAGVPASIRVTTMKPGGTVPKMCGRSPGVSYPTFKYTLRRINVPKGSVIAQLMIEANIPFEESVYTPNTLVFEYPIEQGPARPATEVSLWEQAFNLILLQREWADNAVSNTLYFKPKWVQCTLEKFEMSSHRRTDGDKLFTYNSEHEEDILEEVLANLAPLVKSISVLPHSPTGIFPQMPEEGITYDEYVRRLESIRLIDWSKFRDSDGQDELYCSGDKCDVVAR